MIRRHEALVAEEDVHAAPVDLVAVGVCREQRVKRLRRRAAGEVEGERAGGACQAGDDPIGEMRGERGFVGADLELRAGHELPFA